VEMMVGLVVFVGENGLSILFWLVVVGVPVGFGWRRYRRVRAGGRG